MNKNILGKSKKLEKAIKFEKIADIVRRNLTSFTVGSVLALVAPVVFGANILDSIYTSYDNTSSGLNSATVQDAIDELSDQADIHCPEGYTCRKR